MLPLSDPLGYFTSAYEELTPLLLEARATLLEGRNGTEALGAVVDLRCAVKGALRRLLLLDEKRRETLPPALHAPRAQRDSKNAT